MYIFLTLHYLNGYCLDASFVKGNTRINQVYKHILVRVIEMSLRARGTLTYNFNEDMCVFLMRNKISCKFPLSFDQNIVLPNLTKSMFLF